MKNIASFASLFLLIAFGISATFLSSSLADKKKKVPVELGKVNWNRGFDKALEKAKKDKKPLYVLFQEVPG